jgi:hypothetical protein
MCAARALRRFLQDPASAVRVNGLPKATIVSLRIFLETRGQGGLLQWPQADQPSVSAALAGAGPDASGQVGAMSSSSSPLLPLRLAAAAASAGAISHDQLSSMVKAALMVVDGDADAADFAVCVPCGADLVATILGEPTAGTPHISTPADVLAFQGGVIALLNRAIVDLVSSSGLPPALVAALRAHHDGTLVPAMDRIPTQRCTLFLPTSQLVCMEDPEDGDGDAGCIRCLTLATTGRAIPALCAAILRAPQAGTSLGTGTCDAVACSSCQRIVDHLMAGLLPHLR